VEAYALDELVAAAERVVPGLGGVMGSVAGLAADVTGEGFAGASLDVIEKEVADRGREVLRDVVQLALDRRAAAEPRLAVVADADGVPRPRAGQGRGRGMVTWFGVVRVSRMAYRAPGLASLHPMDAALGLPPHRYSWGVQLRLVKFALEVSDEQAAAWLREITGTLTGKRQVQQVLAEAAADAEQFYQWLAAQPPAEAPAAEGEAGADGEGPLPLVLSVDAKGVAMRPEARRQRYGKAGQRSRSFEKRLGTGEKAGVKRMAQVGVVFDAHPPDKPRTPELIMGTAPRRPDGAPAKAGQVRAGNRWYAIDLDQGRAATITKAFDEADRRDPARQRPWVALVDGDSHQLTAIQDEATARGVKVTILIDLIHVLEYLWKAAWCFHPPRDKAAEAWVITQATSILHGHAATVITRIQDLAARHPPRPGSEHHKNITKTLTYLTNKEPYLDYPAALAKDWPIATSVIEGACRHLVADRMAITGARWGLDGAEAILQLRAIQANGDLDAYWAYHLTQEHHRNHLTRYHNHQIPAA
jgi:hypothetical protein